MKIILILLTLSTQIFAGKIQFNRFSPWFSIIEKDLGKTESASRAAGYLLRGSSRIAAFNLQALGKIYNDNDGKFKDLRKDFKNLEDAIGEYNKWANILLEAEKRQKNKSTIKALKKKTAKAKKELQNLLLEDGWLKGNKLKFYSDFVEDFDFGSYEEDKNFVINHFDDSLTKLSQTEFEMTVLEEGNGVHELRRELRWIAIKARVLGGLFQFKDDANSCPIQDFKNLVNKPVAVSKYAKLPTSELEINPCKISQCLFLGLVEKVNQIGDLKDQIEADLNLSKDHSDKTPAKYLSELNRYYAEIHRTGLLDQLRSELISCKSN
jgi:hypothetical protein